MPSDREPSVNEKLREFKESLKIATEKLVTEVFPQRILDINRIIESPKFSVSRVSEVSGQLNIPVPSLPSSKLSDELVCNSHGVCSSATNGTKIIGFVSGTVHSNKNIDELVDVVKPIIREAVETVNQVKMWILFLIPRIEDGNNFGVSIQEDTLAETRTVEAETATLLDQIARYYIARGKLVTRIAKYPHVEDYRRSVMELDEKEFLNLRLILMEIRNHYSTLHDMIVKNFEKIKLPRTSNVGHLY